MKQHWTEPELQEQWSLRPHELELLVDKTARSRLGFAIQLKYFEREHRFPREHADVPTAIVAHIARNVGVHHKHFADYALEGRSAQEHRTEIRAICGGWRPATEADGVELVAWLLAEALPKVDAAHLEESALEWYRKEHIEAPSEAQLERLCRSALAQHEDRFFAGISGKLDAHTRAAIDALLAASSIDSSEPCEDSRSPATDFNALKADPGRIGLESVIAEVAKLQRIDRLKLPKDLFGPNSIKQVQGLRQRAATEPPSELRLRVEPVRYTMAAAFCWQRRREIIDGLIDLLLQIVHRIGVRAERKVEAELLADLKKVRGKTGLLFKLAEAAVDHPDEVIKEALFPVVSEQTLRDLVKEYKASGAGYRKVVHTVMRASYSSHYRRMTPLILDALTFKSNNALHRPVIDALDLVRAYRGNRAPCFPDHEQIPIEGVVPPKWREIVVETGKDGQTRVNRINYEICMLQSLREALRCKEIWVQGADRFRDPDEDLPGDFDQRREEYCDALDVPHEAAPFILDMQSQMMEALQMLNDGMPQNTKVRFLKKGPHRIVLTPLDEQPEPKALASLKAEIQRRWASTTLLDIFKEAEFRVDLTQHFMSAASREVLDRDTLQRRLLLCLYALGTNTGMKRVLNGDTGTSYKELLYTRRRFVQKTFLRKAIAEVVNATFAARRADVWGEGTTACASDSKKFGAWDQNLMTELTCSGFPRQ